MVSELLNSPLTNQFLDLSFNKLVKNISEIIDKHAPQQIASRKQKCILKNPGLTKGLLTSIKNKQKLYKTFFLQGTDWEKTFYKVYANKLARVKNLSKKMYYKQSILEKKQNLNELWKFINSAIPSKRPDTPLAPFEIIVNDCSLNNPKKIAQVFNDYFVNIGQSIANSIDETKFPSFKTYMNSSVSQTIVLKPPSLIEMHNIINSLNLHKACGHDHISSYFLRVGNKVLAPVLSYYFSCVFELVFFPQNFKTAKVVPIYKSGNKKLVNNCHPISLLSYLLKVLEKLIKSRFDRFFIMHGVLYNFQYVFRQNHSVTQVLLDVTTLTYD